MERQKQNDHYARCEECHRTVLAMGGEFIAVEHFVCSDCMGEAKVFTLREYERSERP